MKAEKIEIQIGNVLISVSLIALETPKVEPNRDIQTEPLRSDMWEMQELFDNYD